MLFFFIDGKQDKIGSHVYNQRERVVYDKVKRESGCVTEREEADHDGHDEHHRFHCSAAHRLVNLTAFLLLAHGYKLHRNGHKQMCIRDRLVKPRQMKRAYLVAENLEVL